MDCCEQKLVILPPEIWYEIFVRMDHESLILMDKVAHVIITFTTTSWIQSILKTRLTSLWPRPNGSIIHHFKYIKIHHDKRDELGLLEKILNDRPNLTKGDLIEPWKGITSRFLFDGINIIKLDATHPRKQGMGLKYTIPACFDCYDASIHLRYWPANVNKVTIMCDPQELINNITYEYTSEGEICDAFTYFIQNNQKYYIFCEYILGELDQNVLMFTEFILRNTIGFTSETGFEKPIEVLNDLTLSVYLSTHANTFMV